MSIDAGGTYTQTASNVTAAAGFAGLSGLNTGNVTIQAGEVAIDAGMNTASSQQNMSQRKTAIGTDINIPILNAAMALRDVARAATETSDGRAQAMAGATLAMQGRDLASAVQNGIADPRSLATGFKVSLALGNSRSESTMSQSSQTSVGSTVSGSGNVTIVAKGIDGEGGNINVIGSQVQAGGNVVLSARDQINLIASQDTYTQTSNSSSSGASIGISFNIGSDQNGFTLDMAANRAKSKADGTDVIHRNTHIEGGQGVTLISGGDTTLKGATISAPTVSGLIGGDLTITSLQDISTYASKQSGANIGVSVCIPPFCAGISSVTGGLSRSTVDGDFTSVTETSGIRAGDGGFQLIVGGNTALNGGVIASSDKAVTDNKNLLQTATLTTSDLVNRDVYEASGFSISGDLVQNKPTKGEGQNKPAGGVGQYQPNGSAGIGSASGNQQSVTRAGISGGTVTITNGSAQHALTGKTVEEMLASLDRGVTSSTADASVLSKSWDAARLQREVNAQVTITKEFGRAAAKEIGDYAQTQMNRVQTLRDTAGKETDEGRRQVLLAEAKELEDNWKEDGGTLRIAAHAAVGGLSGGIAGALGAGASAVTMPLTAKLLDSMNLPDAVKQIVGAAAAAGIGAVAGTAGAASAFNLDINNRQLHQSEYNFAKKYAKLVGDKLGISEEDAEARIIAEIRRNSDKKTADATGPVHDWGVRSILGCPNLNCTGSANDPEYSNHEYNAGLVGANMEAWNASQAILGNGLTLAEQKEANDPVGTALLGTGIIAYGVAASSTPGKVGLGLIGIGTSIGLVSNGVVQGISDQPFDFFSFGMAGATGAASTGRKLLPTLVINSGGAFASAGIAGSDKGSAVIGAVAGTLVGYPLGVVTQNYLNKVVNPWYRGEWSEVGGGVSKYIPPSLAPAWMAGGVSSVGQEYINWLLLSPYLK